MAGKGWSIKFCDALTIASGGTDYTNPLGIGNATRFSMQLAWTISSAATAATTVWTSNKNSPSTTDDTDWVQETGITVDGPTSATGKSMTHFDNVNARWIRLKFVNSAGTNDAINGWAQLKD